MSDKVILVEVLLIIVVCCSFVGVLFYVILLVLFFKFYNYFCSCLGMNVVGKEDSVEMLKVVVLYDWGKL